MGLSRSQENIYKGTISGKIIRLTPVMFPLCTQDCQLCSVLGLVAEIKSPHPTSRISVDVVMVSHMADLSLTSKTLCCSIMGTGLCANPNCEFGRAAAYIA